MKKSSLYFACAISSAAFAVDYLHSVESIVFETTGTPEEIAAKAKSCIAKIVTSGVQGQELFIHLDPQNGEIVANSIVEYSRLMSPERGKSILNFKAKEGRFRITHGEILRSLVGNKFGLEDYHKVHTGFGNGHEHLRKALEAQSKRIADCVMKPPADDNW